MNKNLAIAIAILVAPAAGQADIVETGGDVRVEQPPSNIRLDRWESNKYAFVWFERSLVLAAPLPVNALEPGTYPPFNGNGELPAGTAVSSYMLRCDPDGNGPADYVGHIVFDRPVVALIFRRPRLNDSDAILGRPSVTLYNVNDFRGFEDEGDSVTLSQDRMRVDIVFGTGGFTDDVRIITAADGPCYPDCDPSTGEGVLDIFDFLCFQNLFDAADAYACDIDTSTGPGVCDVFDFLAFQNAFAAGCP